MADNDNRRNNERNGNNPDGGQSWWGAIAAGAALIVAGAAVHFSRNDSAKGTSGGDTSTQKNLKPSTDTRSNCTSDVSGGRELTPSQFQKSRR